MLSKEFNVILDIKRQLRVEQMTVVQGDLNSNVINIKLENDGKEYDLTGTKVEIVFAKPDNTTVLQSDIPIINETEGKIRCVLKTNTIAAPGVVIAEVRVKSAEDDKLLTSAQFRLHVRKSLMSDEVIESTDDFDVLTELIKEVEELLKEAEEANLPELIKLKEELEKLREELTSKQAELVELQSEIEIKETQRDKRYEEMGLLKENMESLKLELEKLEKELLDLKEKLINSIPFINEKGNWQVGDEDTEIKAQGPKGDKGETGGVNSVNGLKGEVTLTGDNIKIGDETISDKIGDTSELETESKDLVNAVNEVNEIHSKQFNEFHNPDAKNSIYRGKYLGDNVTDEQYASIADGTFEDLYIGDYWTIGGHNWRIAAFNYYKNTGNTALTKNHITIVPDKRLSIHEMNETNTTEGGYLNSLMRTEGLKEARELIKSIFGDHLVNHKRQLTNAVVDGEASGWSWVDSEVDLMNEIMVYGASVFGTGSSGGGSGRNIGIEKTQLPLFQLNPLMMNNREAYWLRDIVSATRFSLAYGLGNAYYGYAGNGLGVRPAFSIS